MLWNQPSMQRSYFKFWSHQPVWFGHGDNGYISMIPVSDSWSRTVLLLSWTNWRIRGLAEALHSSQALLHDRHLLGDKIRQKGRSYGYTHLLIIYATREISILFPHPHRVWKMCTALSRFGSSWQRLCASGKGIYLTKGHRDICGDGCMYIYIYMAVAHNSH